MLQSRRFNWNLYERGADLLWKLDELFYFLFNYKFSLRTRNHKQISPCITRER